MRRFICQPGDVKAGAITLTGAEAHHARVVLRLKPGATIMASPGDGRDFLCSITSVDADKVSAEIIREIQTNDQALPISITLAQAVPKGKKMDDIVRMACEIGVEKIAPVITERCVQKLNDIGNKLERWRSIALSAAKQSGASVPADVLEPAPICDIPALLPADLKIALWEKEERPLKSVLSDSHAISSIVLLAGPEGGLTDNEAKALARGGFITASLGKRILRAQTAGIACACAVIYHFGP